jgi:hypothetical protein
MGVCWRQLFPIALAVLTVPLVHLGLRSLRAAWSSLRLWRAVARARSDEFAEVRPGPVALLGQAIAIEPLVSDETGRRGVYLAYSVDRWALSAGLGGTTGQWLRAEEDEQAAPFELTDGSQSLLVDPRGAQILRPPGLTLEIAQPGGLLRYRESLIEERASLVVVGHAEAHGGFEPSAGYRGHGYRLTVTDGGRGDLTIAPPSTLRRALALRALAGVAGALPAAAAIYLLLAIVLGPNLH